MNASDARATPHLLLIGGGHGHLAVLEAMRHCAFPARVTLVTPNPVLTYSGLLPAFISGHGALEECQIGVVDYARAAGASVYLDSLVSLDADAKRVELASGQRLGYDIISLDTGSVTAPLAGHTQRPLLPVRPLDGLLSIAPTTSMLIVGGGAGGIELAFAFAHRGVQVQLVAGHALLPGHHRRVARRAAQCLARRGITVHQGYAQLSAEGVMLSNGQELSAERVILATGASAPTWLAETSLTLSTEGFIAVNDTLQSHSHANVFAIGDVSAPGHSAITRAGVHAVMAGPILAKNLRTVLSAQSQEPFARYRPKPVSLYLLATGPQHAILSWGPLVLSGRWVWWLKRFIDRRFVARYRLSAK